MNAVLVGGVAIAVLLLVVVAVWATRRSEPDTLGSFQRQIDALSPEARRQVVDQVQRFERSEPDPDAGSDAGDAGDAGDASDDGTRNGDGGTDDRQGGATDGS